MEKHIPKVLVNIVHSNVCRAEQKDRFRAVLVDLVLSVCTDIYDRHHSMSARTGCVLLDRHCACLVRRCGHSRTIRKEPPGFIRRLYTADLIKNTICDAFVTVPRGYL